MRIGCVRCGERGIEEFVYRGDAGPMRPQDVVNANGMTPPDDAELKRWTDYVYLRLNPAGAHRELWQHVGGCRTWLVVTRNTLNHVILSVEAARDVARARHARREPAAHLRDRDA